MSHLIRDNAGMPPTSQCPANKVNPLESLKTGKNRATSIQQLTTDN